MRGPNLPLGEWFRIFPSAVSGCPVSPVHIRQHLLFLYTWGNRWCAPPIVMYLVMADESIYVGPSPVGNLKNQVPRGVGIIICHRGRITQPPLVGGSQKTMRAIEYVDREDTVIRK